MCVGVQDDNASFFFNQSSSMRSKFNVFPEHVLNDSTQCLNDGQMPLLGFMCLGGNHESHVIALALI